MTEPLAVQLYTVREQLAADRKGTLEALASCGYRSVEAYDVLDGPEEQRADLDAAGLTVCSAHVPALGERAEDAFRGAGVLGTDTVFVPYLPPERFADGDGVRQVARDLNEAARRAAGHGLRLGYHNHEFELAQHVGGRPALEVLADQLDDEVLLEVDTYWAAVGGQDVVPLLRRLGGRVTHLHIKDGPLDKAEPMTAVGAGRMAMGAIVAEAVKPPAKKLIVELDRCATDMLTAVRESHEWLEAHR
ncbi:sugar phosphate isomerase/epimerase [Streptomyces sp. NPDC051940]|uniref:sugar phosphate isomerase/epimerase family protein n=1 Tax=Streptomyces sp. NPDC051940 TaxID=3155675 RepID=UPI00343C3E9B